MAVRYAVGIVNYGTYEELARCLDGVMAQSLPPARVVVVDHDGDPEQLAGLQQRHPDVVFEARSNRGFAAGANFILACIARDAPDFVLMLNPDVVLESGYAENLLAEMISRPDVALAGGKLFRPEGPWIDSAGITLPRHRRPRDRGSETLDRGQYDRTEFVFGVSGAALMMRCSSLQDLTIQGEVFDEDLFLYHEDTDLAWRASRLGWRALYVPAARAIHKRRWRRRHRFKIETGIRRHSFKNHYLQMIKNERARDFVSNLPVIIVWEIARLGYALLRDPAILPAYREAWRLRGRMWRKRRIVQSRAAAARERRQQQVALARRG